MDYSSQYTVIEDIDDIMDSKNQITGARSYIQRNHVPNDLQRGGRIGKVSSRPDMPDLSFDPNAMNNMPIQTGNRFHPQAGGISGPLYPTKQKQSMSEITPIMPIPQIVENSISCRSVFEHVENCPICESYFRRDIKLYWFIIAVLVIIIFMLLRPNK